ncbi:transcription factor Pcc1-domain-containing protein [Phellopilus nigrolimitatus]|nr:transcription factor Pcc1-domain-containing protein [Phellopilus nigrolimitatus]
MFLYLIIDISRLLHIHTVHYDLRAQSHTSEDLHALSPTTMSAVGDSDAWHTVTVRVPFASPKHASIAKQVIEVDAELQAQAVKRTLAAEGDELVATFTCLTIRLARLTVNSFLENIELVIRTLGEFGEDAERKQGLPS